jgi:hypothetical protein
MEVGRGIGVTGLATIVAASGVASALATPPGANGRIAFTRYTDSARTTGAIFTTAPNGRSSS